VGANNKMQTIGIYSALISGTAWIEKGKKKTPFMA
jgi:hypothetical protein